MMKALNKQYKADKKARIEKHAKAEQERLDREEELRTLAIQIRKREREKRHKELEDAGNYDSSSDSDRSSSNSYHKYKSRRRSSDSSSSDKEDSKRVKHLLTKSEIKSKTSNDRHRDDKKESSGDGYHSRHSREESCFYDEEPPWQRNKDKHSDRH